MVWCHCAVNVELHGALSGRRRRWTWALAPRTDVVDDVRDRLVVRVEPAVADDVIGGQVDERLLAALSILLLEKAKIDARPRSSARASRRGGRALHR
jgi:hypothetical protein